MGEGEVLGVYGLVGSGRTDFLEALYGTAPITAGDVRLFGAPYRPRGPEDAMAAGVAFLPEDRKLDGFVPRMSVVANTTLPVLARYVRFVLLTLDLAGRDARRALAEVAVRGDVEGPMEDLSGGNQQKALFSRAMLQNPRLLLLDEPTKGVDIGAKREIQDVVRGFVRRKGVAAVVVSSEEEEVLALADDVVVFHAGACDGRVYRPADLRPGDLRRLAWAGTEASPGGRS